MSMGINYVVPSEHFYETFSTSGIELEKLITF